jgi:hypothetical protein
VWLCFQPDEPSDSTDSASTPTPAPKGPKKKGKAKAGIKKEAKKEIKKEVVDKRLPVRQGCAATQARAMEQVEEVDLLHTGDDVEDDLPTRGTQVGGGGGTNGDGEVPTARSLEIPIARLSNIHSATFVYSPNL